MSGAAVPSLESLPGRIHTLFEDNARLRPQALAFLDHDDRAFTWAQAQEAALAAEAALRAAGVRAGDRVLIVMENCVAAAAALMGCSRLDAWAVLVNARLAAVEIERLSAHCGARLMLFTTACSPEAARYAQACGAAALEDPRFGAWALTPADPQAEPEPVFADGADQVAAMIYTSGTTGRPKGVMLTHRNLLFIATISGAQRGLAPADRVYAVLPISHVFGLASTFLGTCRAGGSLILVPRFDPKHLAQALAGGVSVFQGVPAMYAKLLDELDKEGKPLVAPALRYMSAGGSPLDIDWKRRIEARFGITLNNGYGLTEASPTVSQTRMDDPRQDDSVGPALPFTEVRIAAPDGTALPDGTVGELWARGPNIMRGYYRDVEATAAAVTPDGWLKTGDLARRDPDGALFIVGRAKELIIRSGFNVYPPEVETVLNAHPAVTQCAVVGRRVSGNEEVVAFVEVPRAGSVSAQELKAFAAERLAPYKRPQHVFILERIPASATGKIQKHLLGTLAEEMIAAAGEEP